MALRAGRQQRSATAQVPASGRHARSELQLRHELVLCPQMLDNLKVMEPFWTKWLDSARPEDYSKYGANVIRQLERD